MYAICDKHGEQHNGKIGYYVYPLSEISSAYDRKEIHTYIFEVSFTKRTACEKLVSGCYVYPIKLSKGKSLLLPETYTILEITPPLFLIKKSLLNIEEENLVVLDNWWKYAISDRKFFFEYLEAVCLNKKFNILNFWVEKARENNFYLHLWSIAGVYTSEELCSWFFYYGLENYDLAYCRLSIRNALQHNNKLLIVWRNYIIEKSKQVEEIPDFVKRIMEKDLSFMFFGDYSVSTKDKIFFLVKSGNVEELERLFFNSANFSWDYRALDFASEEGNLEILNFFAQKAIRYGSSFLCYHKALDLAAFRGHLDVLDFWSNICKLFDLPVKHTSDLIKYAVFQERMDVLYWWKENSAKYLNSEIIYLVMRKNQIDILKLFFELPKEIKRTWSGIEQRMRYSNKLKEWWEGEGRELFEK